MHQKISSAKWRPFCPGGRQVKFVETSRFPYKWYKRNVVSMITHCCCHSYSPLTFSRCSKYPNSFFDNMKHIHMRNRQVVDMMTSSNENILRVTGPLCGEFTGHRWIPHTKASEAELWCFLWSAPELTVEQTMATLVSWDAIALITASL